MDIDPVEQLIAGEEIRQLKARYCRMFETHDWSLIPDVFAPDAVVGPNDQGDVTRGIDALAERFPARLGGVPNVHHAQRPEIELTSPTTATGIWAQEDRLWGYPTGTNGQVHGFGYYHETYVKLAVGWRIATVRVVCNRVEISGP